MSRDGESGFSLVEILVALGLFSLIAWGGFSVLDGVLRTQSRTDGRLERLAELQRAMHLMTTDLEQLTGEPLFHAGPLLAFSRFDESSGVGALFVRYEQAEGALVRTISAGSGATLARQRLIDGVAALEWSFYRPGEGWLASWPISGKDAPVLPAAISAEIEIAPGEGGLAGSLRRVVRLPAGLPE